MTKIYNKQNFFYIFIPLDEIIPVFIEKDLNMFKYTHFFFLTVNFAQCTYILFTMY